MGARPRTRRKIFGLARYVLGRVLPINEEDELEPTHSIALDAQMGVAPRTGVPLSHSLFRGALACTWRRRREPRFGQIVVAHVDAARETHDSIAHHDLPMVAEVDPS